MRHFLSGIFAGALIAVASPAVAANTSATPKTTTDEGPASYTSWETRIAARLDSGAPADMDQLERWCAELIRDKTRDLDGRWTIDAYHNGFDTYVWRTQGEATQTAFDRVTLWKTRHPDSACAPIVEADFNFALALRELYSGYMSHEDMKHARNTLAEAERLLDAAQALAVVNPEWYAQKIHLAQQRNGAPHESMRYFAEGLKRHPDYFASAFSMVLHFLPRNGGDWDDVENFATLAAQASQATQKQSLYARVYWYVSQVEGNPGKMFRSTKVQWRKMRAGFDELMEMWPKSGWNLNNYAAFACRAEDAETYGRLRRSIGEQNYFPQAWGAQANIPACDQRLLNPNAAQSSERQPVSQ